MNPLPPAVQTVAAVEVGDGEVHVVDLSFRLPYRACVVKQRVG
jgi:hypothetical protein